MEILGYIIGALGFLFGLTNLVISCVVGMIRSITDHIINAKNSIHDEFASAYFDFGNACSNVDVGFGGQIEPRPVIQEEIERTATRIRRLHVSSITDLLAIRRIDKLNKFIIPLIIFGILLPFGSVAISILFISESAITDRIIALIVIPTFALVFNFFILIKVIGWETQLKKLRDVYNREDY